MIEQIHVFDFDDTLFDTFNTETFIDEICNVAKSSIDNPTVATALCTARRGEKETVIRTKSLLKNKGLVFDYHIFKPEDFDYENYVFKELYISKLIDKFPSAAVLAFWDDCDLNLNHVKTSVTEKGLSYIPIKCGPKPINN